VTTVRQLANFVGGDSISPRDAEVSTTVVDPSTGDAYAEAPVSGKVDLDAVKGFDGVAVFGAKEARRTSRPVVLGIVAAREAVADSGLDIGPIADDVAVIVASGIGGMEVLERASVNYHERGHKAVSAYTAMAMLVDMPAGMIATDTGARGPNFAIVSACASGSHAIGEAAEQIRRGDAVAALAGGTEAAICGVGMAAFGVMGALSRRNDEPERASRPFDVDRDGFRGGGGSRRSDARGA